MDEKFIALLIAELIDAQQRAISTLTQALCQQLDPAKLEQDLRSMIKSAQTMPGHNPTAEKLLLSAQAAAHAERLLQAKTPGEGPHPKRAPG